MKIQLSEKQKESIRKSVKTKKRIIGNVGAVRSGKTFVNNLIFIAYLALVHRDDPEAKVILAGWSQGSIDTNVVSELQKIGAQVKKTRTGYIINGVRVEVAYTGTNRGADKIQGMTANFAYVNEAALSTEYVFNQIFQRVSAGHYQKILIDANPKGPTHWLKRDYIDKGEVEYTQYRLDDNLHLSADYIAAMKRVNKGDLYKRNILGEWSAGDLIIPFELFKKQDSAFIYQLPFIQGMDLGTDDPTTYVRAYIDTGSHRLFVTDAIFEHPKSTNAIGSMLRKYADERYATAIDTNFPPVNGQLMIEGYNIAPMKGSNNKGKIESGIKKLLNYDLFVDEHLTEMIKELDSYERDSSGEISKEAKKHDHSIDALRYALILYENTRLMNGR